MAQPLYIFIDESGNFDFSVGGTKHFVLTAVETRKPVLHPEKLLNVRYKLLVSGHDQEYFHATEDRQLVRNEVFDAITKMNDLVVDAFVMRKEHAQPLLKFDDAMYAYALESLLTRIFHRHAQASDISEIVVVVGALFTCRKREFVLKKLKMLLKRDFARPFHVYFHRVMADINCQIADYCGWAIYVHYERGESRPLGLIRPKILDFIEVF